MSLIDDLRRRWERDPSSRVFLQLAEEHRRAGDPEAAVAVLERGLEENPRYLSARVALGRCRLELGEGDAALEVLESVVEEDGTHVVASRLLVETHLARGDGVRARRQLEDYSLLFPSDPDIEGFREKIEGMLLGEADAPEPTAAESEEKDDATEEPLSASPAVSRVLQHPRGETLFSGLGADEERRLLDETFAGEGIFPVALPEPEPEAEVEAEPEPAPELEDESTAGPEPGSPLQPEAEAEPEPAPEVEDEPTEIVEEPAAEDFDEVFPEPAVAAHPEEETASPEPAVAPDAEEPQGWAREQDETHQLHPAEPARWPAAGVSAGVGEEVEDAAAERDEPEEPEPASTAADEQETATLGDLFLEQGHRDEARRIFKRVVERDPDNEVARRGLAALEATASAPTDDLTADDLFADHDLAPEAGLTAKKVHLLHRYLDRIRQRDVS